jgi:DNA-binding transcriptional MocR family regulator
MLGELAARWLADGTAQRLVALQRREAKQRHRLLLTAIAPHVARSHPLSLSAWLRIPEGWSEAALVRVLRERKVLVTGSTPFVVDRALAQQGIRICTAGRVSQQALTAALQTAGETFQQLPSLHAVEPLM